MLPRLEAERQLSSIQAMAAAFGSMKKPDQQRYLGRLQRLAEGGMARPVKATPELLAAMGVAVVIEEAGNG